MAEEYVTKEEFLELKSRFNELLFLLSSLELKKKVSFDELSFEEYEDSEEDDDLDVSEEELEKL
jgi:hypothetical protein